MENETNNIETENEPKKRTKREWVKTVAIIFLAVLLVLTFFSQTIMNWSLPEVSGQYAGWGEISTGVRGEGSVTSNMAYNVTLEYSHEIKSVSVRQGEHVEAGQVLAILDESDSEELRQAKDQLEELQYSYSSKLISMTGADYSKTNKNIADMREDLQEAIDGRAEIAANQIALTNAKANVTSAQKTVDYWTEQVDAYTEMMASGGSAVDSSAVDTATNNIAVAKAELTKANNDVTVLNNQIAALGSPNLATLQAQYDTAESEYNTAKAAYDASGSNEDYQTMVTKKATFDLAKSNLQSGQDLQERINELNVSLNSALAVQITAEEKVADCEYRLQVAQNNMDANASYYESSVKSQLSSAKTNLKAANTALSDANEALTEAASRPTSLDDADANIKSMQRQLEDAVLDLQSTQKADDQTAAQNNLDLERARKEIEDQQAIVDKLTGTGENAEIITKYAGTVTNIAYVAGDTVPAGEALFEIEVEDKGYTLTLPVTMEQSKRVQVGDKATVTNWWGNDLDITLDAVKADRDNPGKQKILEFTVLGDVTPGQTLNIVVGDKKTSYDMVVPLSAIREDSNGTFVLVAHAKSTPLGNRYIATRVDVTVIAKDTYNAAIDMGTDSEYNNEFVITTATKPVDAGSQVRLVEG